MKTRLHASSEQPSPHTGTARKARKHRPALEAILQAHQWYVIVTILVIETAFMR